MLTERGNAESRLTSGCHRDLLIESGAKTHASAEAAIGYDDELAEQIQPNSRPIIRIWENGRAVVFPRWRLAGGTITAFEWDRYAWPICARSSGGSAVAHGPGTLNVSAVLPRCQGDLLSIDAGYELWFSILSLALRNQFGIQPERRPVEAAFCSGRFDAAVGGRKLAGVAQFRRRNSVVVHGTVLVHVDCGNYLKLIEAAERLLQTQTMSYDERQVVSLSELAGRPVSARELVGTVAAASGSVLHGTRSNN